MQMNKYGTNSDLTELSLTIKKSKKLNDLKHDLENKNVKLFNKYLKEILNGSEWKAIINDCDDYSEYSLIELWPESKNDDILDFIKLEAEEKLFHDDSIKYFYFEDYCTFYLKNEDIDYDDDRDNYNKLKIRFCDLDKFIKECNVIINFDKQRIEEIVKRTKSYYDNKIGILNKILEFSK